MLNVVVSIFEVESEAYQAITELKNHKELKTSVMSEAVLVDKKNGYYTILDNFVIEPDSLDDMARGGLIGMCVGILGGPLGMLLGASVGSFSGVVSETDKTDEGASMLEQMILKLSDDTIAIIGLAEEKDESEIDALLSKYKTIIARFDAAVVEQEVERAKDMEREMENLAKLEVRKQKKEEHRAKVEERRNKMKARFAAIREKHKKKDDE